MTDPDNDSFATMRHIGKPFNLTSHDVGKILTVMGWRAADGKPSREAHTRDLVVPFPLRNGDSGWRWRVAFVREVIKEWASAIARKDVAP